VPPVAELSSTTAIKSAVAAGIGPAVLSAVAVAPELAAGTLHPVRVTDLDLTRRLLAVWSEGRQLTGPAADLRAIAVRTDDRVVRWTPGGPARARASVRRAAAPGGGPQSQ
jgi:DNA-binding transcriptional LysR family regulator